MKKITLLLCLLALPLTYAQAQDEPTAEEIALVQKMLDSIEKTFTYEYGKIDLQNGLATINVPEGYKFLNGEQSKRVLEDIWGNPPGSETLGMLFPKDISPVSDNFTYAVEIEYADEGYVEDEDAADIDYDELLEEMQNDTKEGNKMREAQGYETIDLVGWASKPFYDSENKKLHWAKELKFEGQDKNTLNYNIRVLGRSGFLNLNAIGDMEVLPQFQQDVDGILASVNFNDGHKYSDFDSSIDKVAAYGIGGLVAGKVLAKAGVFAALLKFWKVIAIGAVAAFAGLRKKFFGGGNA